MTLELAQQDHLFFICGHYEGIDERAYSLADKVISLGDYVLTSGELASMVVIDAVVRRIDGVLGDEGSAVDESFYDGLLEYPQYTRPASYRGMEVPDILLSGHHAKIAQWRREQSLCVPSAGDQICSRGKSLKKGTRFPRFSRVEGLFVSDVLFALS